MQTHRVDTEFPNAAGVAHDINNMLSIVIGNLRMARRHCLDGIDPAIQNCIEMAELSTWKAARLTQSLFVIPSVLAANVVATDKLIQSLCAIVARTLAADVTLEVRLENELWPITSEAASMENALLNLCINAQSAMPSGGVLLIEADNANLVGGDEKVAGEFVRRVLSETLSW